MRWTEAKEMSINPIPRNTDYEDGRVMPNVTGDWENQLP